MIRKIIKCILSLSLVKCTLLMDYEGLQYKNQKHMFTKQYKTRNTGLFRIQTINYIRSGRKLYNHDYQYKDWEESTLAAYDFSKNQPDITEETTTTRETVTTEKTSTESTPTTEKITTTRGTLTTEKTSTTESTPTTEKSSTTETTPTTETTSTTKSTSTTEKTSPTKDITTDTLTTAATSLSGDTFTTGDISTISTIPASTTVEIPPSLETSPTQSSPSVSTVVSLSTIIIPNLTTESLLTSLTTLETTIPPDKNPLYHLIDKVKLQTREGYFTAGVIVFLRDIAKKGPVNCNKFLLGLNDEMKRLKQNRELYMFDVGTTDALLTLLQLGTEVASELVLTLAMEYLRQVEKRRNYLQANINSVFDIADSVMKEEDHINIANFLLKLQKFPSNGIPAQRLANEGLKAFMLIPLKRIEGTGREKLLMLELKTAASFGLIGGFDRRSFGNKLKEIITYPNEILYESKIHRRTSPALFFDMFTKYIRNETIMKKLRQRMKLYKEKMKNIKKQERGSSKRGPTTRTTTVTTTSKPTMHKSNYYIRKYVKTNLYKMKPPTTEKTTKFRIKYYGKIKKFKVDSGDDSGMSIASSYSGDSSNSEVYYTDSEVNDFTNETSLESGLSIAHNSIKKLRVSNKSKTSKEPIEYSTSSHFYENNTSNYLRSIDKFPDNIINNLNNEVHNIDTDIDDEKILKANLDDAMIHTEDFKFIRDNRRFQKEEMNKIRKVDSSSDDEVELKRNIYKVLIPIVIDRR